MKINFKLTLMFVIFFLIVSFSLNALAAFPDPKVIKDRPLKIGYLWLGPIADSCQRHFHQAEIECAHRGGWELIDAASLDAAVQRENMQNLITQDVDAIVITYQNIQALEDLIAQAAEKGIGVYMPDTELRPGAIVNVTSGQGVAAAKMAYWGMNYLNYEGKVAVMTYATEQAERERRDVILALLGNFPGMEVVEIQDMTTPDAAVAYDYAATWVTKYGSDLKWICCVADFLAMPSAEAVIAAGFTRDDIVVSGIDGGNTAYAVMNEGGPFYITSSQPFEWYTHNVFEVINQVQVEGIMPGTEGSMVPLSRMILGDQYITTAADLLPNGTSIHEMYDYYDPNDEDAWYNWPEAGGPYKLDY